MLGLSSTLEVRLLCNKMLENTSKQFQDDD
jgi:hypothetical protein